MNAENVLSDKRFRWISQMYFYVADNSVLRINPFQTLSEFLEARVGDLSWGKDHHSRAAMKAKFINSFRNMMDLYGYEIPGMEVSDCFSNDGLSNRDVVNRLIASGKF